MVEAFGALMERAKLIAYMRLDRHLTREDPALGAMPLDLVGQQMQRKLALTVCLLRQTNVRAIGIDLDFFHQSNRIKS
jgi:hypothetical protein